MNLKNLALAAGLIVAVALTAAVVEAEPTVREFEVKLAPVDIRSVVQGYSPKTSLVALSDKPLLPTDKLPDIEGRGYFGVVRLGPLNIPIGIAVDEKQDGDEITYRVFVDANANGSLKDDTPSEWLKASEEEPASGEAVVRTKDLALRLHYALEMGERSYFRYSIVTGRAGTVSINGQQFRLIFIDGDNDGRYDGREADKLIVDSKGAGGSLGPDNLMSLFQSFAYADRSWTVARMEPYGSLVTLSARPIQPGEMTESPDEPEGRPLIGHYAPLFTETAFDGRKVSLRDYRGKIVLLDFWATWCGPCRAERPHVLNAYKRFDSKDFAIIGISLDNDSAQLEAFLDAHEMEWPQLFDGRERQFKIAELYDVSSIPATFLIDREGKIVSTDLRGAALIPAIERALEE